MDENRRHEWACSNNGLTYINVGDQTSPWVVFQMTEEVRDDQTVTGILAFTRMSDQPLPLTLIQDQESATAYIRQVLLPGRMLLDLE